MDHSKGDIVVELGPFVFEQQIENDLFRVELQGSTPIQSLLLGLGQGQEKLSQVREIFLTRSLRVIAGLKSLDEANLLQAVKAPTDASVLMTALNTYEALAPGPVRDPLAEARLRGLDAKRKLIESEGGAVSAAKAAQTLKITRQAIDKRRREGRLLAVELGKKGYHYPAWQFGLEGFEEVLAELGEGDFWEKVSFFLNPSAVLQDRTPLEVLQDGKKNLSEVLKAARSYGEHGA